MIKKLIFMIVIIIIACQTTEKIVYVSNKDFCNVPKMINYREPVKDNTEYDNMILKKLQELPEEVQIYFAGKIADKKYNTTVHIDNIELLVTYIECLTKETK